MEYTVSYSRTFRQRPIDQQNIVGKHWTAQVAGAVIGGIMQKV